MLMHVRKIEDWDERYPVSFISAGYQHTMRGFRVLVMLGQLPDRLAELRMVWHTQLNGCGGPQCAFPDCVIRWQAENRVASDEIVKPSQKPGLYLPGDNFSPN